MNNLPDILKYLREDSDFKQHELASKLNVARTTIASYESGKATPSIDVLIKYADIFNTTTDFLLGRVKDRNFVISQKDNVAVTHDKNIHLTDNEILKLKELLLSK